MSSQVEQMAAETPDYKLLRAQLNDYEGTFYGPHNCEGCGVMIIKKSYEQGGQSWELPKDNHFDPHHCTHISLFKKLAGRVLTVLDASLANNPAQHKAVKDLIKQEFGKIIGRARELEGDRSMESIASLESLSEHVLS